MYAVGVTGRIEFGDGAMAITKSRTGPDDAIGEKLFREGDSAYDAGDYELAFKKMSKAAALGHTEAMLNLGVYFDVGCGVRRSRNKAMHWFKAVLRVEPRAGAAASNIGTIYRDEGNFTRAKFWFEKALALKDFDAAYELARIYLWRPTPERVEKARVYLSMCVAKRPRAYIDITEHTCEQAEALLRTLPKPARRRGSGT